MYNIYICIIYAYIYKVVVGVGPQEGDVLPELHRRLGHLTCAAKHLEASLNKVQGTLCTRQYYKKKFANAVTY